MKDVVIVGAARTPMGCFNATLSTLAATQLGSVAIKAAVERSGIDMDIIDECIMGCVLPASLGQAPARQAALGAGLPVGAECLTINKVCGSGLKSVMLGAQAIAVGDAEAVVAGGMECMSKAPYALPRARGGYRMGHGTLLDLMIHDGLWDPYNNFHMGVSAELCAEKYGFTREAQDAVAIESYRRANRAIDEGLFKDEIAPVSIPQRKGAPLVVAEDEEPRRVNYDKIPNLKPAFKPDGTVTAANASSINDGAAAVVLTSAELARERGLIPLARIVAQASAAQPSEWFTTAPAKAMEKVMNKAGLTAREIDLYEINEAFAVVLMHAVQAFSLDMAQVNVNGGAIALGHPIGASGNRVLVTLLHAMTARKARRGLATLCLGGGEASALIVERC